MTNFKLSVQFCSPLHKTLFAQIHSWWSWSERKEEGEWSQNICWQPEWPNWQRSQHVFDYMGILYPVYFSLENAKSKTTDDRKKKNQRKNLSTKTNSYTHTTFVRMGFVWKVITGRLLNSCLSCYNMLYMFSSSSYKMSHVFSSSYIYVIWFFLFLIQYVLCVFFFLHLC